MKRLIRDICISRTYQLASSTNPSNRDDVTQFSHARLRRLRADVLLDAVSSVTDTNSSFNNYPTGLRSLDLFEGGARANNYFLKTFGLAYRDSVSAAETHSEPTLAQALHLENGDTVDGKIARSTVVSKLLKEKEPPEKIVDELYLRVLGRMPSAEERKKLLPLIAAKPGDRQGYDDIFWALLNSSEFEFNH